MKKFYLTVLFIVCVPFAAAAQQVGEVTLKDVNIKKVDHNLSVNFTAEIGKKAARSNYKLVLTPVLYKEADSIKLKQIVVFTRKSRIVERRQQISAGKHAIDLPNEYRTTNSGMVNYSLTLPYQEWMNGADLRLDRLACGCCTEEYDSPLMLAENLALLPPPPPPVIETVISPSELKQFQWKFSKEDMVIDFIVSKTDIEPNLFDNHEILAEIVEAVKKIQATRGASLDKIEITGYASPEGRRDFNQQLGQNRSVALKEYLKIQVPGLTDDDFNLINGGENWKGLRDMIAVSEMKDKDKVLYIIDNVPAEVDLVKNTSRKKQLMDLKGGVPYNYMIKNFYPRLRNACYIGVYYINANTIN